MGTQKNRLNEKVLLSTQNTLFFDGKENNHNFTLKKVASLTLCLAYVNWKLKRTISFRYSICFIWEVRKLVFDYKLLSKGLDPRL